MPRSRRQTSRTRRTTNEDADTDAPTQTPDDGDNGDGNDDVLARIDLIEEEISRRFEQIDHELDSLKAESTNDERFLKLCHAVDYLLERSEYNYDSLACREMLSTLLGQKLARPFSGRTIRNRLLCRRLKRWCLFIGLILFLAPCMSIYGLHRNWYYLLVVICVTGSFISSIGLRRIYRIIETIW